VQVCSVQAGHSPLLETRRESFNLLLLLRYGCPEILLQLRDGRILFLKAHRKIQEQEATISQLKKGIEVFAATLKQHATQIQKVSAQLEVGKPLPQTVLNNR
jgi:hypothetical protein